VNQHKEVERMLTRRTFLIASVFSGASLAIWSPEASADTPGAAAVRSARSQVGVPYRWKGAQPGVGFDCSGLTMWAWSQAGVGLSHSSYDQAAMFEAVNPDSLVLGDLVFNESRGHVVLYSGNGNGISAPYTGEAVREAPLLSTSLCVRPTRPIGRGPSTTAAPQRTGEYVVRPGDTLSSIAARNGTTVDRLVAINGITNPDRVQAGRKLRLG
jgi:nucleoid-associated protein YgaU